MSLDHIKQENNVSEKYNNYLNDESGIVKNGAAERIFFPSKIDEIQVIINEANKLNKNFTVSGGGTGISGGRVPLSGWIIATDEMRSISYDNATSWTDKETGLTFKYKIEETSDKEAKITIPISMSLKSLQNLCRELNWFYPVDPTERTSFLGGNIATNASGARTFKYGTTRDWTRSVQVLLPNGDLILLDREGDNHEINDKSIVINAPSQQFIIPRPSYKLPNTEKNVAGPVLTDKSDPIDLFIGTGGMFGVIVEATLKLIRPPVSQISLFIYTATTDDAIAIIQHAQKQKDENNSPIPMSVEYLGPRAVNIIKEVDVNIPKDASSLVMLEQDADSDEEMMEFIEYWWNLTSEFQVLDTSVAQTHSEIEHHKFLRHKVPETVNATVRSYGQAKLGTDCSVPNTHFTELFNYILSIGIEFEKYQNERESLDDKFGYAIWAHAGNSHFHLNLLPRNEIEDKKAKELVTQVLKKVLELNGSIAAEHGLGKKKFNDKPALSFQYGEEGMKQIKMMKESIDPNHLLNHGNLLDV